MTSHTPKSLDQIRENNPILNLNERKLLELARVSDINQLISISQSKKIKGINNDKVLNKDTVEIAQYIITKAEEVLNINIQDIKTFKIENVVKKIGDSLIETKDIESFLIGTYIQKISKQISNIHLRYERKKSFIDKRNLSENNEELTKSNITDPLTGLLNRKGITNYLNDGVEDKNRNGTNYGIMIIDIDYFKDINDNYGHNTGDIALQEISKILVSQFRGYDKVARWGGEEFLVLQKGSNSKNYIKKAEEVRKQVELNLKKNINSTNIVKKIISELTISIGVTEIEINESITEVIGRADRGLYKVKIDGRNGSVMIKKKNNKEKVHSIDIKGNNKGETDIDYMI